MKKLVILAVALISAIAVQAKSVVFTLSDGTKVYYLIGGEANPVMKFVEGGITVNADAYTFSQIKNFYISDTDDPTSVQSPSTARPSRRGNVLLIPVMGSKPSVKVYAVSGSEVEADITVTDGHASVSLDRLPSGTYIVRNGQSSIKVMKR